MFFSFLKCDRPYVVFVIGEKHITPTLFKKKVQVELGGGDDGYGR